MRVEVNGEPMELDESSTIPVLLAQLDLGPGPVAVERNGQVVPRAEHAATVLKEGDRVEVVHFVGGG